MLVLVGAITPLYWTLGQKGPFSALHMGLNHSQGFVKHCLCPPSAIAPQRKDSDSVLPPPCSQRNVLGEPRQGSQLY